MQIFRKIMKYLKRLQYRTRWLPWVILPKDECFEKNYSSFLDFTRNYERMSGIYVPCQLAGLWCTFVVYIQEN